MGTDGHGRAQHAVRQDPQASRGNGGRAVGVGGGEAGSCGSAACCRTSTLFRVLQLAGWPAKPSLCRQPLADVQEIDKQRNNGILILAMKNARMQNGESARHCGGVQERRQMNECATS